MTPTQQMAALKAANCEVAFDNLTRQLYATDASLYQIEPLAVAFPKTTREAGAIIQAAAEAGTTVIPRGAGTGLSGGAVGDGLVVDFARHNRDHRQTEFGKAHGSRRRGRGAGPVESIFASAGIPVRAGRGDEFARDHRRDDCQRFVRLPYAGLWHHGATRRRTGHRAGGRTGGEGGARPRNAGEAARTGREPDGIEFVANRRAISAGTFEALAGLRAGAGRE